jgi:hypothetical protein
METKTRQNRKRFGKTKKTKKYSEKPKHQWKTLQKD